MCVNGEAFPRALLQSSPSLCLASSLPPAIPYPPTPWEIPLVALIGVYRLLMVAERCLRSEWTLASVYPLT